MRAGRVVVFRPAEGKMPPGPYRTGADLSGTLLSRGGADLHSPELYQEYFRRLFGLLNLDEREIQRLREGLRFEDVAQRFQMIDEDTRPVVVPYGEGARPILEAARRARRLSREALRNLQPYVVAVRVSNFGSYVRKGLVEEVREGLWTLLGQYDERKGLTAENRALVI
jgi:CRISPR-associated endonuclease/helicase Cas3